MGRKSRGRSGLRDNAQVTAEDLIDWTRDKLARFKRLRNIIFLSPEEMPRNTTGKILHRVLRDMLAERLCSNPRRSSVTETQDLNRDIDSVAAWIAKLLKERGIDRSSAYKAVTSSRSGTIRQAGHPHHRRARRRGRNQWPMPTPN